MRGYLRRAATAGQEHDVGDAYTPIKGKCTWWREKPVDDDVYDARLKDDERRVTCSCFVEGKGWIFESAELPSDCPDCRACRYYIRHT